MVGSLYPPLNMDHSTIEFSSGFQKHNNHTAKNGGIMSNCERTEDLLASEENSNSGGHESLIRRRAAAGCGAASGLRLDEQHTSPFSARHCPGPARMDL